MKCTAKHDEKDVTIDAKNTNNNSNYNNTSSYFQLEKWSVKKTK